MTMLSLTWVALLVTSGADYVLGHSPGYVAPGYGAQAWNLANFTSLVAFGDSYTDDSRLNYFAAHNGSAPPVGWVDPVNYDAADGGRTWAEYVKQYTGANLYNYAVSGAVCSNDITPRLIDGFDFPAIEQYEVPAYINDSLYYEPNDTKFLDIPADSTVYSMWIGTNDLGVDALLTDSQVNGTNIVTYLDCVYDQLQRIYDNGGRYFVLQNVVPLQLTPLYGLPGAGGLGDNLYWTDKSSLNITEISYRMLEQVVTVNAIYAYRTPYAVEIAHRYPGAHFALMDMYGLFYDIHNNPQQYLNGTPPFNVTGYINVCNVTGGDCVASTNPDAFLWFDPLHPSQQTERIVAQTFVDIINGATKWATYWSG